MGGEVSSDYPAPVQAEEVAHVSKSKLITGETTLYVKVILVDEIHCTLRLQLASTDVITAAVPECIGRALTTELEKEVALKGVASWTCFDGKLVSFQVTERIPYSPVDAETLFKHLAAASEGAFDKIEDVDAYAEGLRSGGFV
jgi:hypothetical protein